MRMRHCVRWGPMSSPKGAQQPSLFGTCLLWPNGRPSQLVLSTFYIYGIKIVFGIAFEIKAHTGVNRELFILHIQLSRRR